MGFFVCMKREGDEKGTAEQSEAKNHPVNGFLVPRAGGGTGPVPPDESPYLHQMKKSMRSHGLFCLYEERRGREGNGRAKRGKKPSGEWFFSSPGWRRHWPSAAGRVPLSPPNKKVQSFWAFCLFWVCYARKILQNDFTRNFTRDFTLNFTLSMRVPFGTVQTRRTVPYPSLFV